MQLTIPLDDPQSPPAVSFVTPIWHPQVELPSLKPCLDVLKSGWKPNKTLRDVLETMRQLIAEPSCDMAVNSDASAEMSASLEKFEEHARADTAKFAMN